ncbi:MAG: transcription antitermination factor NusB [Candidatus Melainabacteria bacterium HGW-Melainabacteria-1]|nr:MAG: transcription antitermination factor NusB [Candidatus Melainabacteria bacterium HGW-Melainabacteria-1]
MGHRRKAREFVLQALYMYETVQRDTADLVGLSWINKEISPEIREFAESLIIKSIDNLDTIDGHIKTHSKNWSFERLTAVDKSILRLCICEMLYYPDIPSAVTINEGIELGKTFGGETSGQFINGILDAIRRENIKREEG